MAAVALAGFRLRRVPPPVACVLGVIGGLALAVVGPVLLLTDDPTFGVLFMPGAGAFLFLLSAGVRIVRRRAWPRKLSRWSGRRFPSPPGPETPGLAPA